MKRIMLFFGMSVLVAGAAFAESTDTDKKTVASKAYVDTQLNTKQNKIPSKSGGSNYVMTHPTTTGGNPGSRQIVTTFENVNESMVPTTGAVVTELNEKQQKITGGNVGDVVVYNGSPGSVSTIPQYDSREPFNDQANSLVNANTLNMAVVNGYNAHLTCNSWQEGYNASNDPYNDHCLTYYINTLSGVYVPQTVNNP